MSTQIYFNYLVATPSLYTQDQLKAYKSLDAYNLFVNGWVSNVSVVSLASCPGTFLALAQVKHSQRISASPLKPWIAVEKVGTVLCAHCTCKAGLGEACSHIAALLFALEANTQMKKTLSCTSLPCSWLPPSFRSVPYAPVSEIDFSTPRQKRIKVCGKEFNSRDIRLRSPLHMNLIVSTMSSPRSVSLLYYQLFPDSLILMYHFASRVYCLCL